MDRSRSWIWAGLLAFTLGLGPAGSAWTDETLTWEQVRKEALAQNPDLAAKQQVVRQAEANVGVAASPLLPQVTGSLGVTWATNEPLPPSRAWDASLTAQQLIFDGFKSWKAWAQADLNLTSARFDYDVADASTRQSVRNSFTALFYAQSTIDVNQAILEIRQKNYDLVRLNYEAGRDHKGSLLLAQAQLFQAQVDRAQADRNLILTQYNLAQQLGRDSFAPLAAGGDLTLPAQEPTPDFQALAGQHPQVRSLAAQAESARLSKEMAEAAYFPTLAASASAGWGSTDWPPTGDRQLSAGVNLSWPLLTGGKRPGQVAAAEAVWQQALDTLRSTRASIRYDLVSAWTTYLQARDNVAAQDKFLVAAEERARIAESEYTTGLITFDNWTIIEDALVSAKQSALNAQAQAQSALAAWVQAQGGGLENE